VNASYYSVSLDKDEGVTSTVFISSSDSECGEGTDGYPREHPTRTNGTTSCHEVSVSSSESGTKAKNDTTSTASTTLPVAYNAEYNEGDVT